MKIELLLWLRLGLCLVLVAGGASLARIGEAMLGSGPINEVRFVGSLACLVLVAATALVRPLFLRTSFEVAAWIAAVILLHLWVAASSLWGAPNDYLPTQLYEIALLCLVILVSVYAFRDQPEQATLMLLGSFYWFSVLVSLASLMLSGGLTGELATLGAGGIGTARVLGMGIVAAVFFFFESGRRVWLLPVPLWVAGVLLSGSRAAVLAVLAGFGYLWCMRRRAWSSGRIHTRLSLLSGVVILCALAAAGYSFGGSLVGDFLQSLLVGRGAGTGQEIYLADRDVIFSDAWERFTQRPLLGLGLGTYVGPFGEIYPHNILLGFAIDGGVAALLGCAVLLASGFLRGQRQSGGAGTGALAGVCFFGTAALFAGTYYDNRFVWIYLALALMIADRGHYQDRLERSGALYGIWHSSAAADPRRAARQLR